MSGSAKGACCPRPRHQHVSARPGAAPPMSSRTRAHSFYSATSKPCAAAGGPGDGPGARGCLPRPAPGASAPSPRTRGSRSSISLGHRQRWMAMLLLEPCGTARASPAGSLAGFARTSMPFSRSRRPLLLPSPGTFPAGFFFVTRGFAAGISVAACPAARPDRSCQRAGEQLAPRSPAPAVGAEDAHDAADVPPRSPPGRGPDPAERGRGGRGHGRGPDAVAAAQAGGRERPHRRAQGHGRHTLGLLRAAGAI